MSASLNRYVRLIVVAILCATGAPVVAHAQSGFDELKARVGNLQNQQGSNDAASNLIEAWVKQQGIDHLTVDQVQWCLQNSLPNATERRKFSVVWTGTLTPPRAGSYSFSVSPINVNQQFGANQVQHSIVVNVASTKVVDVGPTEQELGNRPTKPKSAGLEEEQHDVWPSRGMPIELQGGQWVPIHVEMQYECNKPSEAVSPSAIVAWEGPGIDRQPIPTEVLTLPDGSGKGLQANFVLHDGKTAARQVSQASPNIDYFWATPADVAPANPALEAQLANRLWTLSTAPEFMANCAAGQQKHPYLQNGRNLQCLSSTQRREFLQLLTDNKDLLRQISDDQLLELYRSLRFGAEDAAIDFLGAWMQLHADISPRITTNFFGDNRRLYAELSICLANQQEGAYRRLQDRFLELPDGRCSLPAAYTLTYSYRRLPIPMSRSDILPESPMATWNTLFDSHIDNESISDTARVNWLIAKAQFVESRLPSSLSELPPNENYLSGADLLGEAHLSTNESKTRSRVYVEELARLAIRNPELAEQTLKSASQSSSPQEIQAWQSAIQQVAADRRKRRADDAQLRRTAYTAVLKRRRAQASNQDEIDRYDQLLQAIVNSN